MGQNEDDEDGCGCVEVVALLSGGKDGIFNVHSVAALGAFRVVAGATLRPPANTLESDSFMFQSACNQMLEEVAAAMGLPLFVREVRGAPLATTDLLYEETQGDEVEDLFLLLQDVKKQFPRLRAVSSGALFSEYQRLRVENVCERLGLFPLNFLWLRPQPQLLQEMVSWKMHAILVKVAALGLGAADIGKSIKQEQHRFRFLDKSFGFHQCGEGGEYETLVLDCPLYFFYSLSLEEWDVYTHSNDDVAPVLLLQPRRYKLIPKALSMLYVHHKKNRSVAKHVDTEDQLETDDDLSRKAAARERTMEVLQELSLLPGGGSHALLDRQLSGSCCRSSCKADPPNHCAATENDSNCRNQSTQISRVSAQKNTADSKNIFHCRSTSSVRNGSTKQCLLHKLGGENVDDQLLEGGLLRGCVGDVAPPCCYSPSAPTYPACKFLRKVRDLSFYFPAETWHVVTCAAAAYKEDLLSCFEENSIPRAYLCKEQTAPLYTRTAHVSASTEDQDSVYLPAHQADPDLPADFSSPASQVLQEGLTAAATATAARVGVSANVACATSGTSDTSPYIRAPGFSGTAIPPQCLNARRCGNRIIMNLNFLPCSASTTDTATACMRHLVTVPSRFEVETGSAFLHLLQSAVIAVFRRLLPATEETPAQPSSNDSTGKYSIGMAALVYNTRKFSGSSNVESDRRDCVKGCPRHSTSSASGQSEDHRFFIGNSTGACCSSSMCGTSDVYRINRSGSSSGYLRYEKGFESACVRSNCSGGSLSEPSSSCGSYSIGCSSAAFSACGEADITLNRLIAASALSAISSAAKKPFAVVALSLPLPTSRCSVRLLVDFLDTHPSPPGWPLSCHICLPQLPESRYCSGCQRDIPRPILSEKSGACPSGPTASSASSFRTSVISESDFWDAAAPVYSGSVAQLSQVTSPSHGVLTVAGRVDASSSHAFNAQWHVPALRFTPEQHLFTRGLNLWVPPVAVLPHSARSLAIDFCGPVSSEGAADTWPDNVVQEKCGVLAAGSNRVAEGSSSSYFHCASCYNYDRHILPKTMCDWEEKACYSVKEQWMGLSGNQQMRKGENDIRRAKKVDGKDMEDGTHELFPQQTSVPCSSSRAARFEAENDWQHGIHFKCCQAIRCRRQPVQYTYALPAEDYVFSGGARTKIGLGNSINPDHRSIASGSNIWTCPVCGRTRCCQSVMVSDSLYVCCCNSEFISIGSGSNVEAANDYATDKHGSRELTWQVGHTHRRSIALKRDAHCCDCQCKRSCGCGSANTKVPERAADASRERIRCGTVRLLKSKPELIKEVVTSQLFIGGVSGRVPHSNAFPVYKSVAAGRKVHPCAGAKLKEFGAHAKRFESSSMATEQSKETETTVVAGTGASTAKECKASATPPDAGAECRTAVAAALAESLAVEVAMAARNLQQTIRLCGGALESTTRCGAAEQGEPIVTTEESDSEEGLADDAAAACRGATARRAGHYNTEDAAAETDTFPVPRPPLLLFAFLSRNALNHPVTTYSSHTAAAAEFENDGDIKYSFQHTARTPAKYVAPLQEHTQVEMRPPLQRRLIESKLCSAETSKSSHVSGRAAVLQSMKLQLHRHLSPRTEKRAASLHALSRTAEGDIRNEHSNVCGNCQEAGSKDQMQDSRIGSNRRERGNSIDTSGSCDLWGSVLDANSMGESRGSFTYLDGHLSELLIVPAVVDGDLQGGGHVLLWPLGTWGPQPSQGKEELNQLQVEEGTAGSGFQTCSLAVTAAGEEDKAAEEAVSLENFTAVPHVMHTLTANTDAGKQGQVGDGTVKQDLRAAEGGVNGRQIGYKRVYEKGTRRESCSLASPLQEDPPIWENLAIIREKRLFCGRKRHGRNLMSDCVISLELVTREGRNVPHLKKSASRHAQCERCGSNDEMFSVAEFTCEYHGLKDVQLRCDDASSGAVDVVVEKSDANADASFDEGATFTVRAETLLRCTGVMADTQTGETRVVHLKENVDDVSTDDAFLLATANSREGSSDKAHVRSILEKEKGAVMAAKVPLTRRAGQASVDAPAPPDGGISRVSHWHIRIQEVATLPCGIVLNEADEGKECNHRKPARGTRTSVVLIDEGGSGSQGSQRLQSSLDQHVNDCVPYRLLPPGKRHWGLGRYPAEWGAVVISLVPRRTRSGSENRCRIDKLQACSGINGEESNVKDKGQALCYIEPGPLFPSGATFKREKHFVENRTVEGGECVEHFARAKCHIEGKHASRTFEGGEHGQDPNGVEQSGKNTLEGVVKRSERTIRKLEEGPGDNVKRLHPGEEPLIAALAEKVTEAILRFVGRPSAAGSGNQSKKSCSCDKRDNRCSLEHLEGSIELTAGENELISSSFNSFPLDDVVVYVLYVYSNIKEIFACGRRRVEAPLDTARTACWRVCRAVKTPSTCDNSTEAVRVEKEKMAERVNPASSFTCTGELVFQRVSGTQKKASEGDSTTAFHIDSEENPARQNEASLLPEVKNVRVHSEEEVDENERRIPTDARVPEREEGDAWVVACGGLTNGPCCCAGHLGRCFATYEKTPDNVGAVWESSFRQCLSTALKCKICSMETRNKEQQVTDTRRLEGELPTCSACSPVYRTQENAFSARGTQQEKPIDQVPDSPLFKGPLPDAGLPGGFIPDLPLFFFPVCSLENDAVVQVVAVAAP